MNIELFYPDTAVIDKMTPLLKVDNIVIHHSASSLSTQPEDIRRWHVDERKFLWIGYHFLVINGKVYQTRPESKQGAHCDDNGYNRKSLGVCVIGNFVKEPPSKETLEAFGSLVQSLMGKYNLTIEKVLPHRVAADGTTLCPGDALMKVFKQAILDAPSPKASASNDLSLYTDAQLIEELYNRNFKKESYDK